MELHEFKDGYNPLRGKVAELLKSKYVIVKIGDKFAVRTNTEPFYYYNGGNGVSIQSIKNYKEYLFKNINQAEKIWLKITIMAEEYHKEQKAEKNILHLMELGGEIVK